MTGIMGLKDLGEFGLIAEIKKKFEHTIPSGVEGIGDDCAIIPKNEDNSYVITTDMLVEGQHFLMDSISPFELGHKSLAVNLSDIASMGATPRFSFLSFALPSTITQEWCQEFINGYYTLSTKYNVPLLGGDTTAASCGAATISITAIGEIVNDNIKRRSAAQIGDIIAVSSQLGDSAAALRLILSKENPSATLKMKHNTPSPQIKEGEWLGSQKAIHAMMDISDGVASDITHLCKLSFKGADIHTDKIPHSKELIDLCHEKNWNILDLSLAGGEDYALLMTIESSLFNEIKDGLKKACDTELYAIGEITKEGIRYLDKENKSVEQNIGFRHF